MKTCSCKHSSLAFLKGAGKSNFVNRWPHTGFPGRSVLVKLVTTRGRRSPSQPVFRSQDMMPGLPSRWVIGQGSIRGPAAWESPQETAHEALSQKAHHKTGLVEWLKVKP
jgi:hypothetical protein